VATLRGNDPRQGRSDLHQVLPQSASAPIGSTRRATNRSMPTRMRLTPQHMLGLRQGVIFQCNQQVLTEFRDAGHNIGLEFELRAISAGSSLSASDQLNSYNLPRSYMTVLGVP